MTLTADAGAADAASQSAPRETVYRPTAPVDLRATVGMLRRGPGDPTMVFDGPVIWRTLRTPVSYTHLTLPTSDLV